MTTILNEQYSKYLRSIVFLMVAIAIFLVVSMAGVYLAFSRSTQNQKLLIECTDKRRSNSPCQEYANQRTGSAVGALKEITEAYVLCADKLDGDDNILKCVSERLGNASR